MVNDHWVEIQSISTNLIKHETLQKEDLDKLMRGESLNRPTIADLLEAEKNDKETTKEKNISTEDDAPPEGLLPNPA